MSFYGKCLGRNLDWKQKSNDYILWKESDSHNGNNYQVKTIKKKKKRNAMLTAKTRSS